jgi:hypothetical protein
MEFWEKIRQDLERGFREGVHAVKEGAAILKVKTGELTEEGKKRYKIFELKTKVEREIAELGGRVYDATGAGVKNPMLDARVRAIMSRIKKLEARITKLEGKPKAQEKKTTKSVKPRKKAVKTGKA